jgi:hypothetical protein
MKHYSNYWITFTRNGKYKKMDWHGLDMWSQWNETIMKSSTGVLRKKRKWTERTPYELHKKKNHHSLIFSQKWIIRHSLLHSLSSHTVSPLYISFGLLSGLFDNNSKSYCIHVQIIVLSILLNLSHRASTFSSCLCHALLLHNNPQILHLKCL